MHPLPPLENGKIYHIFNRGVDSCNLFEHRSDFQRFLLAYSKYVSPFVDTFAYALMKNHFHLLVRIKNFDQDEDFKEIAKVAGWVKEPNVSYQLGHLLNSYAQYFNKKYNRTGTLFQRNFKRKLIKDDSYFINTIFYVNANPQHHGVVNDFKDYPHTSFLSLSSTKPTKLSREEVWEWFGGKAEFINFHNQYASEYFEGEYVIE